MRNLFPTLFIGLLAIVMSGCSPSAKTKSEQDISRGDTELSDADEMKKVEDVTNDDYNKMTQVDPNLEREAMAAFDKAIQDDPLARGL